MKNEQEDSDPVPELNLRLPRMILDRLRYNSRRLPRKRGLILLAYDVLRARAFLRVTPNNPVHTVLLERRRCGRIGKIPRY